MDRNHQKPLFHNGLTHEKLAWNVNNVLCNLSKNTYENSPPAKLIAVTKNVDGAVIDALKPLQINDVGENRVGVAMEKMNHIRPNFQLHWIGQLQSNKVKGIIKDVCLVHSLDRLSLAQELCRRAGENGITIDALVQVNVACEAQKGGLAVEELIPFLRSIHHFSALNVKGLMATMPLNANECTLNSLFAKMRKLFDQTRQEAIAGVEMQELSMGMSNDYLLAARNGATMVRVGSALYQP